MKTKYQVVILVVRAVVPANEYKTGIAYVFHFKSNNIRLRSNLLPRPPFEYMNALHRLC